MNEVFFAASVRTPIGKFGGTRKVAAHRRAGLRRTTGAPAIAKRQRSNAVERDRRFEIVRLDANAVGRQVDQRADDAVVVFSNDDHRRADHARAAIRRLCARGG